MLCAVVDRFQNRKELVLARADKVCAALVKMVTSNASTAKVIADAGVATDLFRMINKLAAVAPAFQGLFGVRKHMKVLANVFSIMYSRNRDSGTAAIECSAELVSGSWLMSGDFV